MEQCKLLSEPEARGSTLQLLVLLLWQLTETGATDLAIPLKWVQAWRGINDESYARKQLRRDLQILHKVRFAYRDRETWSEARICSASGIIENSVLYFTFDAGLLPLAPAGQRYERTSTKSQREADRKADKLLKELQEGFVGISGNMRVKEWVNEWLEVYKKPAITEKSYKNYKSPIDNVIIPKIGGLKVNEVTDVHLQKLLNSRAGNSYSDVKHFRDTLKAIFKKARESRLISIGPSEFLKLPAAKKGKRRSITEIERKYFLEVAATHHARLMFKTMLYCGLRNGEVTALSWKDIDFDERMIKVVAAMESGTKNIKGPKTAAGVRKVPIPDEIYYDLLERKGDPFDSVFTQPTTGRRHTECSRSKAWKNILREMDIAMGAKVYRSRITDSVLEKSSPDLVPYCLRHTYCTDLQIKGVPINIAKYLMGHSDISVTANIYTHVTDEAIRQAAELIGVTFGVSRGQNCENAVEKPSSLQRENGLTKGNFFGCPTRI